MPFERNRGVPVLDNILKGLSDTAKEAQLGEKLKYSAKTTIEIMAKGMRAIGEASKHVRK